jgi:hypothetical protein
LRPFLVVRTLPPAKNGPFQDKRSRPIIKFYLFKATHRKKAFEGFEGSRFRSF